MVKEILEKLDIELPENIIQIVEEYAKKNKISSSKLEELVKAVHERYLQTSVEFGEAVGTVAAQSIGEPGTQMMMRTKHYAGVAMEVTRGLPRLIEIFDARSIPSTPRMDIFLVPEFAKDEKKAKIFANKIIMTTVNQLARTIDIDFANSRIGVKFDNEKLQERGMKIADAAAILKKELRYKLEVDRDTLFVYARTSSAASLYALKDKVRAAMVSGISNIEHAVIQEENGEYVIYTRGSNLKVIIVMDEVDKTRTISNDPHQLEKVFGIEAARTCIIKETIDTLRDAGLTVDVRHVMLVAEIMTVDGAVKPIGRHGVSGQKGSVLARASFEETVKHLLNAAMKGERDTLTGVVENVIVGQVVSVGTGLPKLVMKEK